MTSVYRWQGKIENTSECLLIIKTQAEKYNTVEALLLSAHSYAIPEIIAFDIAQGLPSYLNWIDSCFVTS
jgi:periplasmic divalent cation tolerance protein